jgi:hypothetical protein
MWSLAYTLGNAVRDGGSGSLKGWFMGGFLPPECGLRACDEVEVKWGIHREGESKETPSTNDAQSTLTLLIRGQFEVTFTELDRKVTLIDDGDYVIFAPGVKHHWISIKDSIVITVRWPSATSLT